MENRGDRVVGKINFLKRSRGMVRDRLNRVTQRLGKRKCPHGTLRDMKLPPCQVQGNE